MWPLSIPDPWVLANDLAHQATVAHLPPARSYPPSLPVFQQNWNFPTSFRQSYRGLYRYLPRLFQTAHHWRMSIEHASHYFARMSKDVEERGSFPGLSERHLLQAYHNLINILQYCQHHRNVSSYIRQQLSRSLMEFGPSPGHGSLGRHSYKAPQLFRAYAEISRQTMSRWLGHDLHDFFHEHAPSILADDLQDLAIWAHAIYRSNMRDDDKLDCLALIVDTYPELIRELRATRVPVADELWPVLIDVANRDAISVDGHRGRARRREPVIQRGGSPIGQIGGWGANARSLSPSPSRTSIVPRFAYPGSTSNMIARPISAPGRHSIIRQADRVIELADDTADEAQILKERARR